MRSFLQAEERIRDTSVTGVQTCALPSCGRRLRRVDRVEVILNASAYNAVHAAETAPAEALAVNALGPRHLAWAARQSGALLVRSEERRVGEEWGSGAWRRRPR